MKKYFAFIFFVFFFCGDVFSQIKSDSLFAVLIFEKDTIDYGIIDAGSNGYRILKFTNTGNAPLIIHNVQTNGGGNVCRSPKPNEKGWPTEPIPPGGTGIIYSCYCTDRVGPFFKNFYVTSNSVNYPTKMFYIKGNVLPSQ